MFVKELKNKITNFIIENKIFVILFILSTTYFIVEQFFNLSWDLSVFTLNAQYLFAESLYFEVGRPPLPSVIIGLYGMIFNWATAQVLYKITVSTLFAFSIYKLAKTIKFNPAVLYALSLNVYVLLRGLSVGTELLSLSLLTLTVVMILKNNALSGIFLGLTALTRYTALAMFPFLIFHFKTNKIIKSLILFSIVVGSWLLYNLFKFGNMFESIANQYFLNVINRQYMVSPPNIIHFIEVFNVLTPFFLIGFIASIIILTKKTINVLKNKKKSRTKSFKKLFNENKTDIIMLLLTFYVTYNYLTTPLKISRYLFFLVLPGIYFSYKGLNNLLKKYGLQKYLLTSSLIILAISTLILSSFFIYFESADPYEKSIEVLDQFNLTNCYVESNVWPLISYLGKQAAPSPRQSFVNESIDDGKILLLFKTAREPEYASDPEFINQFPVIYEDYSIYVVGKKDCKPEEPFHKSYAQQFNEFIYKREGYEVNTNPCFLLFRNHELLEKTCNLLNLNGFTIDENRAIE